MEGLWCQIGRQRCHTRSTVAPDKSQRSGALELSFLLSPARKLAATNCLLPQTHQQGAESGLRSVSRLGFFSHKAAQIQSSELCVHACVVCLGEFVYARVRRMHRHMCAKPAVVPPASASSAVHFISCSQGLSRSVRLTPWLASPRVLGIPVATHCFPELQGGHHSYQAFAQVQDPNSQQALYRH